jgi:hypothetical protein
MRKSYFRIYLSLHSLVSLRRLTYLHIPNKITKRGETVKIKGISRFISKIDYVDTLVRRCWTKADPFKLEPGSDWNELIAKGNTGDFYELTLKSYEITCTCHAFNGISKAFEQDDKAIKALLNHEIAMGQIPDKHVFAAWKYLGAETQRQYEYCWMERREKAMREHRGKEWSWEFEPDYDPEYA